MFVLVKAFTQSSCNQQLHCCTTRILAMGTSLCCWKKMRSVMGAEMLGELQALLLRRCSQKQQFLPRTADKEKEEAMLYQCTVYDHDHWMQHHSSARYA